METYQCGRNQQPWNFGLSFNVVVDYVGASCECLSEVVTIGFYGTGWSLALSYWDVLKELKQPKYSWTIHS